MMLARLPRPSNKLRSLAACQRSLSTALTRKLSSTPIEDGRRPRALEFVFVRHGESEGNVAYERSLQGDHSLYQGDFLEVCPEPSESEQDHIPSA